MICASGQMKERLLLFKGLGLVHEVLLEGQSLLIHFLIAMILHRDQILIRCRYLTHLIFRESHGLANELLLPFSTV